MVLDRNGQEFVYEGVIYKVGDEIIGTDESEYKGLRGIIFEIRDGEDKETENEDPDIYCEFEAPTEPEKIAELEATFSDLYRCPKTLEDIALDYVIMAPEMIKTFGQMKQELCVLKAFVEEHGWKVSDCTIGANSEPGWEISQYSPVGEDFSFSIEHGGDVQKAADEIMDYYYNGFDVDEHVETWIKAKAEGVSGVPSARELVKDAEAIDEMLRRLSDDVEYWLEEQEGKTIDSVVAEAKDIADSVNQGGTGKNDVEKDLD